MNQNAMCGSNNNIRMYIAKQLAVADKKTSVSEDFESAYDMKKYLIYYMARIMNFRDLEINNADEEEKLWKIILEKNWLTKEDIKDELELIIDEYEDELEQKKKTKLQELIKEDSELDTFLQESEKLLQKHQQKSEDER